MKLDTKTFAGRLRLARVRAGKTQEEVAHRLRLNQTMISFWETAAIEPKTSQVMSLCDYLGVTPSWLLGIKKPARAFLQEVR